MDRVTFSKRPRSRTAAGGRTATVEGERRIRRFLRGFGIEDEAVVRQFVRRFATAGDGAVGEARLVDAVARWLALHLGQPHADPTLALSLGRVAWLTADAGTRWPEALLGTTLPPALAGALRRKLPNVPPPMLNSAMPAAALHPMRFTLAARRLRYRAA